MSIALLLVQLGLLDVGNRRIRALLRQLIAFAEPSGFVAIVFKAVQQDGSILA
jgi:hypothetical protein